jgi:hypothetical protein
MSIIVHHELQTFRQNTQGFLWRKNPGKLASQPGTSPQFASHQNPVSGAHRDQCGLFADADAFPAAKTYPARYLHPFPVRRYSLVRTRPYTFSAADTQLRFYHGIFSGNKSDIHNMRPGTPVGAGGNTGPEMMVMSDPALHIVLQEDRPTRLFDGPGHGFGKPLGECQAIGASARFGAPAGNNIIG